jgi:hypothetical protein
MKTQYTPPAMVSHRAGANDAVKIPSVCNGQRVAYKPPGYMCTGLNRGSSGLAA